MRLSVSFFRGCAVLFVPLCLVLASCTDATSRNAGTGSSLPHSHVDDHSHATLPSTTPSVYPDRIVLTWSKDPASTLSVSWRTDSTVTGARAQIAVARAEPSFYTEARTVRAETTSLPVDEADQDNVAAHYHTVTFEGLESDSLYAYRVGNGTHWSEWVHARTASDEPEPFSFIYLGDAQNNIRSHWSRLIRQAYADASNVSFMVHAGDLVNNTHSNLEWGHWNEAGGFIQRMVPSVAVPGNHEYEGYPPNSKMVEDTVLVNVHISGSKMDGEMVLPNGYTAALTATRDRSPDAIDAHPLTGTWGYSVAGLDGTLQIDEGQPTGYSGVISDPRDGSELVLQNISVEDDSLSGEFLAAFEEDELSIHWRPQFALPENGPEGLKETVYYLDHQGMRVIGLNSAGLNDENALVNQTAWLESTLEDARQDDGIRWIVATFHHPMFSSGEGRNNEWLRKAWKPIFDEYNVDLVMQGHDHTYARGRASNLSQGVNARSPVGGTVYVNSVSGAKMYEIKPNRWDDFDSVEMKRGGENTQLYQVVHVKRDTMTYRSYTATGTLYDAFDLVKRPGEPNEMIEHDVAGTPERTHENTILYERP